MRLKGGVRITEEHVLFKKYDICKKLGAGRLGTVYLVYHRELEEYRAMKVVPKTMADYETFRKEALFLKTLRHPGIPLIYDVFEIGEDFSEKFGVIIEQFLDGESLYAMVKRLGSLSMQTTVDFGIQICRIIQFMNTAEKPILHLDLQPKNLLVCDGTVRLIDFDHAKYALEVEDTGERYGTVGFAAPEQYNGEPLDCRTDVYAIGALLYYMCRGKPPEKEPEFGENARFRELDRVIRGCMASKKEDRYANAGDVELALTEWNNSISNEQAIKSLNIIFAGAKAGIGTTHAALGFANFLTRNGYPTLYQESYDTDSVRNLVRNLSVKSDEAGVYHFGCLNIRPFYGKSVKLPYRYYPIIIRDIGTSWREKKDLPAADLCVLVCGGKWWETDAFLEAARALKSYGNQTVLLWNHMPGEAKLRLPEDLSDIPCLNLPFFTNPLKRNKTVDACYTKLLSFRTGESTVWKRKRFGNLFRKRNRG